MDKWRWLVCLTIGCVGCDGGTGGVTLDAFPRATAEALCAHYFKCCDLEQVNGLFLQFMPIEDPAECAGALEANLRVAIEHMRPSMEAGFVTYDQHAVQACLSGLSDRACSQGRTLCDPDSFLPRHQALGEPCVDFFSCKAGTCDKAGPDDPRGTCTSTGRIGERCADQADCQASLTCGCIFRGVTGCAQKYCRSHLSQGSPCSLPYACADELTCGQPSTCEPLRILDETCQGHDCELGLMCDPTTNHCTPSCY